MDKYKKLAEHEIGWWKAHHRKQNSKLLEEMAKRHALQYNASYEDAVKIVTFLVKAAHEHDIAESLEDKGNQKESDVHWKNAQDLIEEYFKLLDKTNN